MWYVLSVVLLCPVGCNGAPPPRQIANSTVPAHSLRDRFVGEWRADTDTSPLILQSRPDGSVVIELPNVSWDYVINNVRWEGDQLCFDVYGYVKNREAIIDGYDGTRYRWVLMVTENPDRLKRSQHWEKQTTPPIEDELKRGRG